MIKTNDLLAKKSQHTTVALDPASFPTYFAAVPGWAQDGSRIVKTCSFFNTS